MRLKHDLVNMKAQNRVGGNSEKFLKGMEEDRDIDCVEQYTCCKVGENRMDKAEGLQGLGVGMRADILPYFIR